MSSGSDREVVRRVDKDRIIVRQEPGGFSIEYRGTDPDTRYLPRRRTRLREWWETFRLGLLGPHDRRTSRKDVDAG